MREYHRHTYIDSDNREAMALCPDGNIRKIKLTNNGLADTFFSIPGRVQVKGKTVTGYIHVESVEGFDTATDNDPAIVKFRAYTYGKNYQIFEGI